MRIPSFLCGRYGEVKSACRKKAKALSEGASWEQLAEAWVDASEAPGLLVLEGPSSFLGSQAHVQFFALVTPLSDPKIRPAESRIQEIFDGALKETWSLLCFMGQDTRYLLADPGRHKPYMEACRRLWPEIESQGVRYSMGLPMPKPLWGLPNNMRFVLARMGVATAALNTPLPPRGLPQFLEMTGVLR